MKSHKDISLENIRVTVQDKVLIESANLKIQFGEKYGLIGHNGVGKTVLLKNIVEKKLAISKDIDIFYVDQEHDFESDKPIYKLILEANKKKKKMLEKYNSLKQQIEENMIDDENIFTLYENMSKKIVNCEVEKDESVVRKILKGLGFSQEQQNWPIHKFSGGWKMKVSLAKGLYMKPDILLLDEPNNHLDLMSIIWLTDYLVNHWKKSLIVVAHDRNFLNEICTKIVLFENKNLHYYSGNFDQFEATYRKNLVQKEKEWLKIMKKVTDMRKKNIKKDEINKFLEKNAVYKPLKIYRPAVHFDLVKMLKSPAVRLDNICFSYENKKLFENVNFDIDLGTRTAFVGVNGVGKSTLFKLIMGELKPTL